MSNVRDFGATGDGATDDTSAIEHAIEQGDGWLEFPRGDYVITRTLRLALADIGRTGIHGSGGTAKLVMRGAGPALAIVGTHQRSADPASFSPEVWSGQRLPTIDAIEIEGAHAQADGIYIEGAMQPTLTRLLIRECRHAIHLHRRVRNVIIGDCHIYHNRGIGVWFDQVDAHQAVIGNSHISYCRQGGIRISNSAVRNLQIVGNDIEYNNYRSHANRSDDTDAARSHFDPAEPTADIFVDVGEKSVREGTIAGNTIQATYSPAGANIRFVGGADQDHHAGMWTISGNLIGSQRNNIHLSNVRGVTISGNFIYSAQYRNILVERSRNVVLSANNIGHNPDYGDRELATGIRFEDCRHCIVSAVLIEDAAGWEAYRGRCGAP